MPTWLANRRPGLEGSIEGWSADAEADLAQLLW
jgi:hypothetical protein